jgi:Na+/H+ antiporter NhaD/arsenite permease-like protein
MTDFQIYLTLGVFAAVILLIAFDLIDMMVAALIGVSVLIAFGVLDGNDLMPIVHTASGPLALLFGGMVVARVLDKTGVFEWLGEYTLHATGGSGKRLLLIIVALLLPLNAFLPNATVVILVAPIIIRVCQVLEVDFVGPLIITAIVSNAAGMLTLVSDPATFLVGRAIGLSFVDYLRMVSLGGLLAALVVVPFLPRLLPQVWSMRTTLPPRSQVAIKHPAFLALALFVVLIMVVLFIVGESLPIHIVPPQVAIIGASLALLVAYGVRVEPVGAVIRDVDWKTLVFLGAIFTLVQAFIKTDLLQGLSIQFHGWFGSEFTLVALVTLASIGTIGRDRQYPAGRRRAGDDQGLPGGGPGRAGDRARPRFRRLAQCVTLPVFVAMMFGGTLGGNATLIGASANIVAVGICASNGRRVSFMQFLRIGLPITVAQLSVGALYVLGLTAILD